MNREDLIKFKKSLTKLNATEEKKRNEYLWDLANNKINGPLTGYSSIDKQWLKYYQRENVNLSVPKESIVDFMYDNTKKYANYYAISPMGIKSANKTFKQQQEKIEEMAKALVALGVKEGEIVSVCLPNMPEVGYIFYAINKIGAISNMLDPRTNKSGLTMNVNAAKSKVLFTLDSVTDKFIDTNIEKIIPISAINFMPKLIQKIIKSKNKDLNVVLPNDSRIISYDQVIKDGKNIKQVKSVYKENAPAVICYTGGTTGVPKGVIQTNEAFNAMIVENSIGDYNVSPKDTCLNIAPPWTYYGLSNCLNSYFSLGTTSILIPALGPDDLGKLIAKYRPNHIITVPSALIAVLNEPKLQNKDLKFLKTIIVGADKLDPTFEIKFNEFLLQHNSSAKITKGYGMTEVCAAATYTRGETNIPGTVGVPYILENVAVFDINDSSKECLTGEQGEIAINGPKNMVGYFGENECHTGLVIKKHDDGTLWVHTGDIGHQDSDGKLYIDGRLKRMFVRNGFKIFPSEIESQILKNSDVEQSAVVSIENSSTGLATKAFLVLKNNCTHSKEEVLNSVNATLNENLYDYELPDEYEFIDKMPLTLMQKIDYTKLEEQQYVKKLKKE